MKRNLYYVIVLSLLAAAAVAGFASKGRAVAARGGRAAHGSQVAPAP